MQVLLNNATATGAGTAIPLRNSKVTFQATGATTASAGAATIAVEVSNDGRGWLVIGTITLTLSTTVATDGFAVDAQWNFVRANVTAISGTGAAVTVTTGGEE